MCPDPPGRSVTLVLREMFALLIQLMSHNCGLDSVGLLNTESFDISYHNLLRKNYLVVYGTWLFKMNIRGIIVDWG